MRHFMALSSVLAILILQYSSVALVSSAGPPSGWKTLREAKFMAYSWNLFLVLAFDHSMSELGNMSTVRAPIWNLCLKHGKKAPYMSPIEPGKLYRQIFELFLPPLPPPSPVLIDSNVTEAPLPSAYWLLQKGVR
ncbi:uncharacterized protein HKW66_Vig0079070 [Vigna angularis]|uniref:CASP-like protein n=1 Tax=Phaseolus angularis TaxID=3914 RepID=A0A8T0K5G3_PHAAN|nr:uncharacterized protein HKW66_Vig0079070 [Vigna angularis]